MDNLSTKPDIYTNIYYGLKTTSSQNGYVSLQDYKKLLAQLPKALSADEEVNILQQGVKKNLINIAIKHCIQLSQRSLNYKSELERFNLLIEALSSRGFYQALNTQDQEQRTPLHNAIALEDATDTAVALIESLERGK